MFIETKTESLLNLMTVSKISIVPNSSLLAISKPVSQEEWDKGKLSYCLVASYGNDEDEVILYGTKDECETARLELKKRIRRYSKLIIAEEIQFPLEFVDAEWFANFARK